MRGSAATAPGSSTVGGGTVATYPVGLIPLLSIVNERPTNRRIAIMIAIDETGQAQLISGASNRFPRKRATLPKAKGARQDVYCCTTQPCRGPEGGPWAAERSQSEFWIFTT